MLITKPLKRILLSTDTKPTGVPVGSTIFEYDTKNLMVFSGSAWMIKTPAHFPYATTTIDLDQVAGNYDLFTVGTDDVRVLELTLIVPANLTGAAAGALTSISIQSTDTPAIVFISAAQGAKANLSAGAHLQYHGIDIVAATEKIQLSIAGGATAATQLAYVFMTYDGLAAVSST